MLSARKSVETSEVVSAPLSWPQDVSHEPSLKIGEVIAMVSSEFPFLAASKIRHFESQGLILPHRTPANQRLFSLADVERLRFILTEQRDRYAHYAQIKEMLRQLDSGEAEHTHPGRMRVISEPKVSVAAGTRVSADELARLSGLPVVQISRYFDAGLLAQDSRGRVTSDAVDIVRYTALLEEAGVGMKVIKAIHTSAHAHAVALASLVETERRGSSPLAKERAASAATELMALISHLYRAQLSQNLDVEMR